MVMQCCQYCGKYLIYTKYNFPKHGLKGGDICRQCLLNIGELKGR